jgi:membrane protein
MWLAGSALFSIYTANFARYNETYGSMGAVVVVMLWLFLTGFVVLFGAELNAEIERQTRKDSTAGRAAPLGSRGAYAADTVGETAEQVKARKQATGSIETRGKQSGVQDTEEEHTAAS